MIPLSAKETVRHEVGDFAYLLAIPTLMTRAAFRRSLRALGAVYHSDSQMLDCLRDGIREVVIEEQRGPLLDAIDSFEYETRRRTDNGITDADDDYRELLEQLTHIETFMRAEFPRFAQMEADRGYWMAVAPIVAFRHFVNGWESPLTGYTKRGEVIPEAILETLPEDHISDVGLKCIMLMRPAGEQEKNSASPSQSPEDPEPSTADASPVMADPVGKSEAKSTRRIRH